MDVIFDFVEVLTKILTCGKCKVGENLPPLSHDNHNRQSSSSSPPPEPREDNCGSALSPPLPREFCQLHDFDNLFLMARGASVTVSSNSA